MAKNCVEVLNSEIESLGGEESPNELEKNKIKSIPKGLRELENLK